MYHGHLNEVFQIAPDTIINLKKLVRWRHYFVKQLVEKFTLIDWSLVVEQTPRMSGENLQQTF